MNPPDYFDAVARKAAEQWDLLEQDQELAAPWHQLFKQVQSPRHVISELLQNADDAGATHAGVTLADDVFTFEHNGEDFTADQFASLCRFGYSNKRALHTIGFRGIGFKSTFSLGNEVELHSPTLAVSFHRARFTAPVWIGIRAPQERNTKVRVRVGDERRRQELRDSLYGWLESPLSLLFFRNLRSLAIDGTCLQWERERAGPIADSAWMRLAEQGSGRYLHIRSADRDFPEEALAEIRDERMVNADDLVSFPPCRVELVLGARGSLFVVLPTGVSSDLPFACNAPFIQDPSRLKIKDPSISPTNRWLLERVGMLAAAAMDAWVNAEDLSVVERVEAYELLPGKPTQADGLEGACGAIVREAMARRLDGAAVVLASDGATYPRDRCAVLPRELASIWPDDLAARWFSPLRPTPVAAEVSSRSTGRLVAWKLASEVTKDAVLEELRRSSYPRPDTWGQLLRLWAWVSDHVSRWQFTIDGKALHIIPVEGSDMLHDTTRLVRLGEGRLLTNQDDWDFLSQFLSVVNVNWLRFMSDSRRTARESGDQSRLSDLDSAMRVLDVLGLDDVTDPDKVLNTVASELLGIPKPDPKAVVRLAHIYAAMGAAVSAAMKYRTVRGDLVAPEHVLAPECLPGAAALLPVALSASALMDPAYAEGGPSCPTSAWLDWLGSPKSKVAPFAMPVPTVRLFWRRTDLQAQCESRGYVGTLEYRYSTNHFEWQDWDFSEQCWARWNELAEDDELLWCHLLKLLMAVPDRHWTGKDAAYARQVSTNKSRATLTPQGLPPAWVMRLRELPCIQDTRGKARLPRELMMRTPDTEALRDIEPFVDAHLDTEANRPALRLLEVRDKPMGPQGILRRLRALAGTSQPPVHEVERWYRRLDQLHEACSTDDRSMLRTVFRDERLILAQTGEWMSSEGVFVEASEEDAPGAALIRPEVRELAIWSKLGVPVRPTADLAIEWLRSLPSGAAIGGADLRRVQAICGRHPVRVWHECGHWPSLSGAWAPTATLAYSLGMQSLVAYADLHPGVRAVTADVRTVTSEALMAMPFRGLQPLASVLEERPLGAAARRHKHPAPTWARAFGNVMKRFEHEDEHTRDRIRGASEELERSLWVTGAPLDVVPYLAGVPAGTARRAELVWRDGVIHVDDLPIAKLARVVPERLARRFAWPGIEVALAYCYGRGAGDVTVYLEGNFPLTAEAAVPTTDASGPESLSTPGQPVANAAPDAPQAGVPHVRTPPVGESGAPTGQPAGSAATDVPQAAGPLGPTSPEEVSGSQRAGVDLGKSAQANTVDATDDSEPRTPRPQKPALIERYATSQGFGRGATGDFQHRDGRRLLKEPGSLLPWVEYGADGSVQRSYLPKEHSLEREPIAIDAAVWTLLEQAPGKYALILLNVEEEPVLFTGKRLVELKERGHLVLHPATYRLVLNHSLD